MAHSTYLIGLLVIGMSAVVVFVVRASEAVKSVDANVDVFVLKYETAYTLAYSLINLC